MPSPFENLTGPGKPLKAEPPDAKEFAGLKRAGLARLLDASNAALALESRFDLGYNAATGFVWPRCAGMDIGRPTATSSSSCCRTRWHWAPRFGACCRIATSSATWVNTRAT